METHTLPVVVDEPTPRLRFVSRRNRMILQQVILLHNHSTGETSETWRDIPVESEVIHEA